MDLIPMSKEELSRLEVMQRLDEKRLRQKAPAEQLGISVRQVKCLLRAYRREGAARRCGMRRHFAKFRATIWSSPCQIRRQVS